MATQQPQWRRIANLGDVNPLEYGGYFVFRDMTGVYPHEAELLQEPVDDERMYTVYRFPLEQCKVVTDEETHTEYLVPLRYQVDWPHHVSQYDEWFHKDLASVARCIGSTYAELRAQLCSDNPLERAHAYRAIGDYHGFENLDSYPLQLGRTAARRRYHL